MNDSSQFKEPSDNSAFYDVIVVGGGHAGCEAALAAARVGAKTLLISQSVERIAAMSCNPAIGGTAKGHLVKEIDALGGAMGKAIDATGIQFRVLNRTKGPAIWSSRAQADMDLYRRHMKHTIENTPNLWVKQDTVDALLVQEDADRSEPKVVGVVCKVFGLFRSNSVCITSGTFLNGLIHIGDNKISSGRFGEAASYQLADFLRKTGLRLGRLKTGTTPRLDARSIDYSELERQDSDTEIIPFSFSNTAIKQPLLPCHITYTNEKTHAVIRRYKELSPLYSGTIVGVGPRYCPSIEDKVFKFPDRAQHQIFLEPQGYDTVEVYPNGISTSLPLHAQQEFVRTIKGLEHAEIIRAGYAIEYDFVDPTELRATLETKKIRSLFLAGQINGTTGYEEAGAQGLVAGANAGLQSLGRPEFVLSRSESYIGVMIDDLITKGTTEPYRMFTSRAEHRLTLREDNADRRLSPLAYQHGLVSDVDFQEMRKRENEFLLCMEFAKNNTFASAELPSEWLTARDNNGTKLETFFRRPDFDFEAAYSQINSLHDKFSKRAIRNAWIEIKYQGYVSREKAHVKANLELEKYRIPDDLDFKRFSGLSNEIVEKLRRFKPENLGQASRISGMTPAAISLLLSGIAK